MRILALLIVAAVLSACGNKGPLYLPAEKLEAQPRIPAAAPPLSPGSIPQQQPVPSQSVPSPR